MLSIWRRASVENVRSRIVVLAGAVAIAALARTPVVQAQTASPLNGVWTLNRALSEFPKEFAFTIDVSATPDETSGGGGGGGGGRGRRGGGGARGGGGPVTGRR